MFTKKFLIILSLIASLSTSSSAQTLQGQVSRGAADSSTIQSGEATQSSSQKSMSEQNSGSDQQRSSSELKTPLLTGGAEHGEIPVGVLGCQLITSLFNAQSAEIIKIYPGSDLLRFGVQPGDRVVGINGHRFIRKQFAAECRGIPGTRIDLIITHREQEMEIQVLRKDAREFASNVHYFRKWAAATKYW
jgi:hypothetical protein